MNISNLRIRRVTTTTVKFEVFDQYARNMEPLIDIPVGEPKKKVVTTIRQLTPVEALMIESWYSDKLEGAENEIT